MAAPQLWCKFESGDDIKYPSIGTGGVQTGSPTYAACKFGNGITVDRSKYAKFPTGDNNINVSKGTIEFWAKMTIYVETTNVDSYMFDFVGGGGAGISMMFDEEDDDFLVSFCAESAAVNLLTTGLDWSLNDLVHIAVTWDRTGTDLPDSKTGIIYWNGDEEVSTTTKWNADTSILDHIYIGTNYNQAYDGSCIIDNLKTYNVCKTDFSDRDTEGVTASSSGKIKIIQPYFFK